MNSYKLPDGITLASIAKQLKCTPQAVRDRFKRGWSLEKILSTPIVKPNQTPNDVLHLIDVNKTIKNFGKNWFTTYKSKVYAICTVCRSSVKTTVSSIRRTLNKRNNEYVCGKCRANSKEGRAQRLKQANEVWSNPKLAAMIIENTQKSARSKEGRAQRSKQSKEAWQNEGFANKQIKRITDMFRSEKHRKLVSDRNKQDYINDPDKYLKLKTSALHTKKARENHRAALQSEEYKAIHRDLALKRMADPEMKAKIASSLEKFGCRGIKSVPEFKVEGILNSLGVEPIAQSALGPYNFDFFIPSHNLYIEVQGEYWHHLPKSSARDTRKLSYLRSACPDRKIVYIWDYELLDDKVFEKLSTALGKSEYELKDFNFDHIEFKKVDKEESERFLEMWHRFQYGIKSTIDIGAYLNNELIAIAKFSNPVYKTIAKSMDLNSSQVIELSRFCIHPNRHKKNFASFFLSNATKLIFKSVKDIQAIIAFTDITEGCLESICRACNWQEASRVNPGYVYRNKDGWMMHKKTLCDTARQVKMNEKDYAESHGWEKVSGLERIEFILNKV